MLGHGIGLLQAKEALRSTYNLYNRVSTALGGTPP